MRCFMYLKRAVEAVTYICIGLKFVLWVLLSFCIMARDKRGDNVYYLVS